LFKTRRISTDNDFFALHDEWNKLVDESECQSIFLTWEWLYTWWQHFHAEKKLWIVEVRDETDRLVGLGPFYIQKNRLHIRSVRFLGNDQMTAADLLDVIVHPDHSEVIRRAIFLMLQHYRSSWDIIILSEIDEHSPTVAEAESIARRFKYFECTNPKETCPVIHLPADYEQFIGNLGSRSRRNIRNFRKRLIMEQGVNYDKLNGTHPVQSAVAALHTLHLRRHEQIFKYSALQHQQFRDFQLDATRQLNLMNRVTFHALHQKENTLAMCCCLTYKNQLFFYQGGFESNLVPKNISIMLVLLDFCIQDAIAQGIYKIHLLRGESNFKNQFTATHARTVSIVLGRNVKYFFYLYSHKIKLYFINRAKKMVSQRSWNLLKIRLKRTPTS